MFNKAKSITELYEEAKTYDLVITNDAPLATALNKLVEKSRLELLAMTPKQIASKFAHLYYDKIHEKYEVVLNVSKKSDKPIRLVHQLIEKIYEIWMYNAKFEFIENFLSENDRLFLDLIKDYDTIETALENFNEEFYGDKRIAVIGEDIFSLLDLEVLPRRGIPADKIELIKEGEFEIDKTYIFSTDEQLINNITDLINSDNADETAIVLDPKSEYTEILKARLNSRGISIEIKNYLSEDPSVKNLISFIELSLRINELKVKELISLLNEFRISIDSRFNQYDALHLKSVYSGDKKTMEFFSIAETVAEFTYSGLSQKFGSDFQMKFPGEFLDILEMLELADTKIDKANLIDLKYFLKEFDTELESEKSGVLFVNALSSAFIDRQIIFYTGLDKSWMKIFPDKDHLNKEEEDKKNLMRFKILLQQGEYRFYFVKNVSNYKEVIPCYYFMEIAGRDIRDFNDRMFNPVIVRSGTESHIYEVKKKKLKIPAAAGIKFISPSRFNNFYRCPKQYSFDLLVQQEDSPVLMKGTLLHSFAEFYFNHPEFVKKNSDKILDRMTSEMNLFRKNLNREYLRNEFRLGMDTIISFLDEMKFKKEKITKSGKTEGNDLMKKFKKEKLYQNTESWLPDPENSMLIGKIDLKSENTIVDYKSSYTRKSETSVSMQSNTVKIAMDESEDFDFQAVSYMTSYSRYLNEITFIYKYLLSDVKRQIEGSSDGKNTRTVIKYYSSAFKEYIYSEETYYKFMEKDEKVRKFLEKAGYENYKRILDVMNLSETEYYDKKILTERFAESSLKVLEDSGFGFADFRCRTLDSLINNYICKVSVMIYKVRTGNTETGLIFRDDVDNFKKLVQVKLNELNKFLKSVFPAEPLYESIDICRKCNYLNICQGNKLWH